MAALAGSSTVAVDTEFMRERTYYARLCLVQLATADHVFVLDAIALGDRIAALGPLMADPATVKVFHAGSQDIEIIMQATGAIPSPVFDTQVAATLAGFPSQVGYSQLVKDLLGVAIEKGDTYSDWARRPLTNEQIEYAADDVRHLVRVHALLSERLTREGRLPWLAEDFARLADPSTYEVDPREQYRRVKRASTLDRRGLAVLRELAAWRELEARQSDVPRRWLLSDESLVEVARRRPRDAASLAAIRGVNDKVATRNARAVATAVEAGEAVPEDELPRLPRRDRIPADVQPVTDVLAAVLRTRAREHGVAPTLLATRDELERFAAGDRDGHPLMEGWRRTLIGAELERLLRGERSVMVAGGRLDVVEPPDGSTESDHGG